MPKNKTGRKSLDIVNDDPRVTEVFSEGEDGYWLWLNPGWTGEQYGPHDIHEYNVRDVLKRYRQIEPCKCESCTKAAQK